MTERPSHHLGVFLAMRLAVTLGVQVQGLAIGWQVYSRTGDPLQLGFVGLAQFAPLAMLSLVAGSVADRFDRRRLLLTCQLLYSLASLALAGLATSLERDRSMSVVPIYAVLAVLGAVRAFAGPASVALLPAIVPAPRLPRAIALSSSTFHAATIAGPALGGFVYASGGAVTAYLVAAALEIAGACFLFGLGHRPAPPRDPSAEPAIDRLLGGVRYVWGHKVLLGAISLDLFAVLLGGAVALMPVYARDILQVGETGLGVMRAAPAAGALVVALWLSYKPLERKTGAWMLSCVAAFGLATIVFGVSRNFALSIAALVVLGGVDMVSVVIRQSLIQIETPDAMRGRVAAVNLVFIGASNELGEMESGATAALLGTVPAVVVGGIGTLIVTALWAALFPSLRKVDRLRS